MAALNAQPDFVVFLAWLRRSAVALRDEHCRQTNERLAGGAVQLTEAIAQAENAPKQLEALQRNAGPAGSDVA